MQQHIKGVVGILLLAFLEIYCSLQQWKNFANLWRIDKVIAKKNRVSTFFGPRQTSSLRQLRLGKEKEEEEQTTGW